MDLKPKYFLLFISFILLSCSHKNEFGQSRINFNLKKIKTETDESVYNLIDTSKIYVEILLTDNLREPVTIPGLSKRYLKFYKNGRVGEFKEINFDSINSFNPKRAQSYLYHLKNGKFIVQVYFTHPQCGQCFIKEELIKISPETFELKNDSYISTYKAVDLPKEFLIYKPDW